MDLDNVRTASDEEALEAWLAIPENSVAFYALFGLRMACFGERLQDRTPEFQAIEAALNAKGLTMARYDKLDKKFRYL